MQKRLKIALFPTPVETPAAPLDKLECLKRQMPATGYIRQAGLIPFIIPISPATLWRWVSIKQFPPPIKLGPKVTAWRVADVEKWLLEQQSRRSR